MGARKPPMMAGFQAEENLTGRAPKKCAKNSGRYPRKPPMMAGFQAEENLTGRAPKNVQKTLDVIPLLQHLPFCQRAVNIKNLVKICNYTVICHRTITKHSIKRMLFSNSSNDIFSNFLIKAGNQISVRNG